MAKTVRPNLNRTEIFDRINLKRTGNEFAPNVGRVAEHFRESFARLLAIGQSALVVIKLHVVGEHRHEKIDIVRVKKYFMLRIARTFLIAWCKQMAEEPAGDEEDDTGCSAEC